MLNKEYGRVRETQVLRHKTEGDMTLVGLSDLHFGSKTQRLDLAEKAREWILKNKAFVWDLGDTIELATRYSVGAGVYEQTTSPDIQLDHAVEFYRPIAEKGLLLGFVDSNHHARAYKESGINVTKQLAARLDVPYFGHSGFLLLYVGDQRYVAFGHHGVSGSATPQGKVAAIRKLSQDVDADIILMGHVHTIHHHEELRRRVNPVTKGYEKYKKHYVITGSYVDYEGGYPQQANYIPEIMGTPAIQLNGSKKDIKVIRNIVE